MDSGVSSSVLHYMKNGSWIRKLFDEGISLKQQFGENNVFDFSLGNPIIEPPEQFISALREEIIHNQSGKYRYIPNQGLQEAREQVSHFLSERYHTKFSYQHIVMTVGAGGGLNVALKSILNPGDEVIILSPYFVEYHYYVINNGGVTVYCDLNDQFEIDYDEISKALSAKTKAIIVNTPHNPTGTAFTQVNLNRLGQQLTEASQKYEKTIYMIFDEPYGQLLYDEETVHPFKAYLNTILVSSFSKDLGIAGERLGYIAIRPEIQNANLLVNAFIFCNRTLGFVNAPALMQRAIARMDTLFIDSTPYLIRRELIIGVLQDAGYEFIRPKGGFFVFPKSPIKDDVEFCMVAAQKFRLLIVPGSGFGREGYFRISYSVPIDVIENSRTIFSELFQYFSKR
ncbi:pyridoxal phosphate-dependent aminotransferase [Paenibacillus woosongensis]|uniref:Aminotransferase n=1 Tax=Paenibacillus woosongensis TaxID=307580 RepID=A0AA95KWX3_9BACL|nr:pyridoxal phosphate-dependent aminotransferase [Paenibacillus woosongensis]WHX50200.1 pyridoxal phosphate-dependent aminotransferase [Paenibacillus woosongensis]